MTVRRETVGRLLLELGVVVVGILIALGVDRLNQGRLDRVSERSYLRALAGDLEADTVALGGLIRSMRDRRAAAGRVLGLLEGPVDTAPDPAALAWDLNYAGWVTSFEPTDFTYRELMSTGGLALIEDAGLKRGVVAYYEAVDFYSQFSPLWHETARGRYRPEVRRLVSADDWHAIVSSRSPEGDGGLDPDAALRTLREAELVPKLLVSMTVSLEQQAESFGELRSRAAELLARLPGAEP